jgi:hypothetical protein
VKNEEALHRVKEERNILPIAKKKERKKKKKANWIGYILVKSCLLKNRNCRKHIREESIRKKM